MQLTKSDDKQVISPWEAKPVYKLVYFYAKDWPSYFQDKHWNKFNYKINDLIKT